MPLTPKPASCRGCPLYGDGLGFVKDELVDHADVMILAQNPGKDEEGQGIPMVGKTGQMMERDFFPLAGLSRGAVSIGNLIRCRWTHPVSGKKIDKLPKKADTRLSAAIEQCSREYLRVPPKTRLLVAQGEHAWRFVSHAVGPITDWRGYLAPTPALGVPTFGTLHLASLFYDKRMMIPAQLDWLKIPKILQGTWPEPVPPCPSAVDHSLYGEWFHRAMEEAPYIVMDTEYHKFSKELSLVGMGFPDVAGVLQGMQYGWYTSGTISRSQFIRDFSSLIARKPTVWQNFMADGPVIEQNMGIPYEMYAQIDDTMLAHAVLFSEWAHTLEFIDSICGKHPKLKHLQNENLFLYNWGDVLSTYHAYKWLWSELEKDRPSFEVYRTQSVKLIPHLLKAKKRGIMIHKPRAVELYNDLSVRVQDAGKIAAAYCGYPINLDSSPQLQKWVYEFESMPVQKDKETHRPTLDADAVSILRREYLDYDPEDEREGLTVEQCLANIAKGGHPLLEARALHINARQLLSSYIIPLVEQGKRKALKATWKLT